MRFKLPLLLILIVVITGCAAGQGPSEEAGMIIGGVLGGVLGAQVDDDDGRTVAIIAGTMIGSAIGGRIGRTMDDVDRMNTARTLETVRTGVPSRWRNPDTGYEYSVVPTRTFSSRSSPCREYTIEATIAGTPEMVTGVACRDDNGDWIAQ